MTNFAELPQWFRPEGPAPSALMVVGEMPTRFDLQRGAPFSGHHEWQLRELFEAAGMPVYSTFRTLVLRTGELAAPEDYLATTLKARTPEHVRVGDEWVLPALAQGRELLLAELEEVRPIVVLALGNLALWALTGFTGVRKWRGSILQGEHKGQLFKVVPSYNLNAMTKEYALRAMVAHDTRRAVAEIPFGPKVVKAEQTLLIRPTFPQAMQALQETLRQFEAGPMRLAVDIETRAGHTACLGIATSPTHAYCIPFMCVERAEGYWTLEEEIEVTLALREVLIHSNADLTFQNGTYDIQYEYRWHFILPRLGWDTMIAHHAMDGTSLKSLDYLSSLYLSDHAYWKDDGKLWDPSIPEDDFWRYNLEDCTRTFRIREAEEQAIAQLVPEWPKLPSVIAFQHRMANLLIKVMNRGVRSNDVERARMTRDISAYIDRVQSELEFITEEPLNVKSPKQMATYFYEILNLTPIYKRLPSGARGNPTTDDDALVKLTARTPLLHAVTSRIQALRSANVFRSTFLEMARDIDGRIRCAYNVAGTKTYRLASRENAFGTGGNLQNIPSGDEEEDAIVPLPNVRRLFLFDPGMRGFDVDGDSADLRIVTGEAGCKQMQAYFAAKVKPYVEIAREYYRDPTITKHHPSYKLMKALCHGTNYGGEGAGLAGRIGLLTHEVDRIQAWYFGMCPEIKKWQEDAWARFTSRGYVENPFGYRLWCKDRPSRKLRNELLAWVPQSSVGNFINRLMVAIDDTLPEVEQLLQVHDSATGQYPEELDARLRPAILALGDAIVIDCASGPIRIPLGIKTSLISWGECA